MQPTHRPYLDYELSFGYIYIEPLLSAEELDTSLAPLEEEDVLTEDLATLPGDLCAISESFRGAVGTNCR